jgi:BlaI family transcriptional regulator, penicillinase repressor
MKSVKISEAEWQVMNVVWERSPVAAGEIVSILQTRAGWRPRTIRTLLDRLAQKGALKVLSDGKRRYAPAVTMEACIRRESRTFMERVFGGEPAPMLLHLIKDTKLTRDEIGQLKKLLSEKEK